MNQKVDRRTEIKDRIYKQVKIEDTGYTVNGIPSPCHLWKGPTSGSGRGGGYGRISINGVLSAVHRVAYAHFFGYIPAKKQVDHLCNVHNCCNPEHLELVSHIENQKRRDRRRQEKS